MLVRFEYYKLSDLCSKYKPWFLEHDADLNKKNKD